MAGRILTLLLLLYLSAGVFAQTAGQTLILKPGFNFVSFTAVVALTPQELKTLAPAVEDIYLYNAAAGGFLSAGEGTLTSLSAGRGYIIKNAYSSDATVTIPGAPVSTVGSVVLKQGFNLIGFSKVPSANITFSQVMNLYSSARGFYKWSPSAGAFLQVIRDQAGAAVLVDGVDPSFRAGESYFINSAEETSINYDGTAIYLGAGVAIPPLAGARLSKTLFKTAGGLSVVIKDMNAVEQIVAIGYNRGSSYASFDIAASALNASAALKSYAGAGADNQTPDFAGTPAAHENLGPEQIAVMKMDIARRANERVAARLRGFAAGGTAEKNEEPSRAADRQAAVGDLKDFYSLNSLAWPPYEGDWTRVSAKLRAIGSRCYIYEDTSAPYPYMPLSDAEAERIKNSFDSEVYPKITQAFGSEPKPGVDGDERVYILFSYNVNKQSAAGYFDSTNQLTQAVLDSSADYNKNSSGYKYYSNEKEMFYMAAPKSTFSGETYLTNTLGVIAHEFQHMINWNQHSLINPDILEESWLNEGLSQLAQDIAGYGYQYGTLSFVIEPFLRYPESYSLTKFQFGLGYYGNAYLFARYLADRGANPMNLVKSSKTGRANVEDEVKRISAAADFDGFFEDFAAALYLSNSGVTDDAKYNFTSIDIRAVQKDGTSLGGLRPGGTLSLPASFKSQSLSEYALSAVKCSAQSAADYKLDMTDSSGGGIGAVILRISGQ
ncbi:MAG: hypothetical protein A2008_02730 [Candidatus Wallbacteria bacterium GWC2_49_35]|uniref:Uncharacterized protein n=1 Tax=Candidatus Wallbacteria bacterium GWC2_49_35 TaxID=1817813 RepID=A0A1F7WN47_9BACT|nr:MAG: hypothetical protein A2008_02730 [Candidatus Wallbacteria bacterium GWC2_49_35]HBC76842.1 hypothetical protein [Candidatus Wallbacteria bacterium]